MICDFICDFICIMKVGRYARRLGKALFLSCFREGLIDEKKVGEAVTIVLAKKPKGYWAVLNHFCRLLNLEMQKRRACIESATHLQSPVRDQIVESLRKKYGEGLRFDFSENPDLLGGFRIQVGFDVYDGSLRSRLSGLAASFASH